MTARDTMTGEQYAQHVEIIAAQAPPLTATQIAQLSGLFDYETPHPDSPRAPHRQPAHRVTKQHPRRGIRP